jgi:SAM-dependent methyltransferase
MDRPFKGYAYYYDLLYRDKDYEGECDFLEEVFRRYSPHPVESILDAGCGTGGHAIPLSRRGYRVTGFDLSEEMASLARQKASQAGATVVLRIMDMRDLQLEGRFDAIISMFSAPGYLSRTEDVLWTLYNFRRHLRDGGLLVFDVWNGLAVLRILPSERLKVVEDGDIRLLRFVRPELDAARHLCHNHYRLLVLKDRRVVEEIQETHTMRFFFPEELAHYLKDAGFSTLRICPFPDLDGSVDETVWNVAVIAQAR